MPLGIVVGTVWRAVRKAVDCCLSSQSFECAVMSEFVETTFVAENCWRDWERDHGTYKYLNHPKWAGKRLQIDFDDVEIRAPSPVSRLSRPVLLRSRSRTMLETDEQMLAFTKRVNESGS